MRARCSAFRWRSRAGRQRAWWRADCRCATPSGWCTAASGTRAGNDADTARLETDLAERLGASVRIEPGRKGAGRIVIRYASLEELDGIVTRVGVPSGAR